MIQLITQSNVLRTGIFFLLACTGCSSTAIENNGPSPNNTSTTHWDRIEMQGLPVGYQSLTLSETSVRDDTAGAISVRDARSESSLVVKRFGQTTREDMVTASRESTDGRVIRVETKIRSGSSDQHVVGRRVKNTMQWMSKGAGKNQQWEAPLPESCGGYFAVEWSLRKNPMDVGETREVHAIVPVLNQVASVTLVAEAREPIEGHHGREPTPCLKIQQALALANGVTLRGTIWVNDAGEVLRSEMPSMQQVTYRTTKEHALAAAQHASFDLGSFATIPLAKPIPAAHQSAGVDLQLRLTAASPADVFPQTEGQSVRKVDDHTGVVSIRKLRPGSKTNPNTDRPLDGEADVEGALGSSALIQPHDPAVTELANQIRTSESRWDQACAIERLVHELVEQKDFSTALASSADVARKKQGDCTEHSVLMAAVCRAVGIPARVLLGLVYVPSQQAFVFHMWNEVRVDDQWIPMDATLGQGGTGAGHIVLRRTNLASENAFDAFLPLINVIGQLQIEALDDENLHQAG